MNKDFLRLFILLSPALLVGLIIDQVFACLFIVSLCYIFWQHARLHQLLEWMKHRKDSEPPDHPGVFEDLITEIDRLQNRHKKRKKKLSNYLQQFHQATAALPDATVVLDKENQIEWANNAARQFLGIHWPKDQGQRITNLIRSPALTAYLNDKHVKQNDRRQTLEITSPLDQEVFLSVRLVPYGKSQRLFVARDVTRMQKLIEIRKDFVANVSHELKTPLTVLSGYVETMIQNKKRCPKEWQPSLDVMQSQVVRMDDVIKQLLMLSRMEEKRSITHKNIVIVPEMIKRLHNEAMALSGDNNHLFEISSEPELWLRGNEDELYSAFSNLLFNAVRYTPANGVIRIRWYKDKDGAHMEISDNGIGIPPQHISRLTERFYRVEQSRNRDNGGSGLGLAIAKHALSRHKALLHIESEIDKGSLFRCDFPVEMIADSSSSKMDQFA